MVAVDEMEPVTTPAMAEVAHLCGVTRRYGAHTAVDDVSLTLRAGEVVALLGPNGAGKTTAIKLLLGLLGPDAGEVRIFGGNPRETATRTRIGAMLQVARVPETLKVKEYVDLFRSYYPAPLSVQHIVRVAGLAGIENRMFSQLSGGQKQRLLFALAICGNPDLIFLDEPTLGMDIETRHALWQQVRDLAAQGKTVLLTTHYLEEADGLASRIVVINKGKVIAEGTPSQIKAKVTGRTIKCVTDLEESVLWTLPEVTSVEVKLGVTIVRTAQAEAVIRQMLRMDESLHSLEITSPALEDAFLALTKGEE
ncbi:ABC transporter ATP-binding protein [Terriglobus tenax]|uniref:ABC transporter ATP-binding protein n=1 Tax=Terriglobus tenax TaxID=1111115 RepID=UPI0021DFB7C2|nr:ABC transporter ATP-binding protein [Terriglobus tenax]